MPGLDEVFARLSDEYGVPEEELEPLRASSLRKKLVDAEARAARTADLERELSQVRKSPLAHKALEDFGVQFDQLRPGEIKRAEGFTFDGDTPTPEEIAAFVSAEGFPVKQKTLEQNSTQADQIAAFAAGQSGGIPQSNSVDYSKAKNMAELQQMHEAANQERFTQ